MDKDPVFGDSVEDEVFSPLPAAHPTHRPDPAPFHQHTVECTVDASNGVCFCGRSVLKCSRSVDPQGLQGSHLNLSQTSAQREYFLRKTGLWTRADF